ncbi:hypothetical protein ACFL31_00080 [Candidatus Margulisiibacteriota bacterium]
MIPGAAVVESGGAVSAGDSNAFFGVMQRLHGLLQSLVEGKGKISKDLLSAIKKADEELRLLDEQMKRRRTPEIKQKLSLLKNQLEQLLQLEKLLQKASGNEKLDRGLKGKIASLHSRLQSLIDELVAISDTQALQSVGSDSGIVV